MTKDKRDVDDKYFVYVDLYSQNKYLDDEFETFQEHVHYFEEHSIFSDCVSSVKDRLAEHIAFWKTIRTESLVRDTVKHGCSMFNVYEE